jgi:hypothetical protein
LFTKKPEIKIFLEVHSKFSLLLNATSGLDI